jgi:hypothetical protein
VKVGDLVRMNAEYHTDLCGIVIDVDATIEAKKVIRVLFSNPNISRLHSRFWRRQEIFEVISEAK